MGDEKQRSASVGHESDHTHSNSKGKSAENDDVFESPSHERHRSPKPTPETTRRHRSPRDHEHRSRSMERQVSHHSSRKSHHSDFELHECSTKTDLIRASAKRAEERRRSSEHGDHHSTNRHKSASSSPNFTPKRSPHPSGSSRRQSVAIIEVQRTSRKRSSASPKRSLSTSPKHKPPSSASSKTSLLEKQNSNLGSPLVNYAGLISASEGTGTESRLFPHPRASGYSKPAMEVAVAALVFCAGVITLIVALVIGSTAWMIVGAISMGIGGVFMAFGACFYMSRHKPLLSNEEQVEIRIVDQKQLAELSEEGFKVRAVMDL